MVVGQDNQKIQVAEIRVSLTGSLGSEEPNLLHRKCRAENFDACICPFLDR